MELTLEMANEMMRENGDSLNLNGTPITSLPDNLTVGGSIDLVGTPIKNQTVKHLKNGDYVPGRYLYADGILTHVKRRKTVNGITYYQGKILNRNVVSDGENYAHCSSTGKTRWTSRSRCPSLRRVTA